MGKRWGTRTSRALVLVAVSLLALLGLSAVPALAHASVTPAPVTALERTSAAAPASGGSAHEALSAKASSGKVVTPTTGPALPAGTKQACAAPARIGQEQCQLFLHGNRAASGTSGARPALAPVTGAYGPSDLQSAYNLTSASSADGAGTTVAIVDAYSDPNLVGDVATYRAQYGLPACDSTTGDGCVTVENQNGAASPLPATDTTGGWEAEQAADAEMVSAICPGCKILMVEANGNDITDLGTAENTAAGQAKFVSNSWTGYDYPGDSYQDADFNHPGTAIVFASGDGTNGQYDTGYPSSSQLVTSVGGTYLTTDASTRAWNETVWNENPAGTGHTGWGCSAGNGKPAWQTDTGCANRTGNDVAAVASGPEGISVYSSYQSCMGASTGSWCSGYGTSISAPIITAVYALAGTPEPGTYPSSYLYESGHAADLYPVTSGSVGTCESSRLYLCNAADSLSNGYNGPAGWGTPNGVAAFQNTVTSDIVSPYNPGPVDIEQGIDYSQITQLSAVDSASGQTVTYSLDGGMPPGLTLDSSSGLISGTPTSAGTWTVTVTAADGTTGSASSIHFRIGVTPSLESAYHAAAGPVKLDWDSKCLDDTNNSSSNGNKIQIWTCNGGASQNWTYYPDTDPGDAGEVVIQGKCLDIVNQGTANGAKLQLWSCTGGANQQWYIVGSAGELYNPVSGKCIDDPYNSEANGTQLDIWSCNGQPWQAWTLPASPVLSGIGGKCLDDTNGSSANGNKIQIYNCNGLATQKWTIGLDGTLQIEGKCLDASGYGTTDGTELQLWSCTGATNQEWEVTGWGQMENVASEKCLADPGNTSANGTQMALEDCYGDQGTVWAES
jgi:ricin-type beta-trefoil lectin protein/putative Ig domain-containing protein